MTDLNLSATLTGWLHRMAHRFGLAGGYVWSVRDEHGRVWRGLRCKTCGRVDNLEISWLRTAWSEDELAGRITDQL